MVMLRDFGPYGIICVTFLSMVMLRDFGPYGIIYICYIPCYGNVVKGFWALWDNMCYIPCYGNVKGFWTLWDNIYLLYSLLW
jgi:hypothetical protein